LHLYTNWSGATRGHMSPIAISPAICYHCDVILTMTSRAYSALGARSPHSHYDVIRYWAGHAHRYGRTYLTAFNV